MKPPGSTTTKLVKKLRDMDWAGFLLSAGTLISFVMVLTFGGARWAWDDNRTIATFVVCGVLLILTVLQQKFAITTTQESRMTPAGFILKDRTQVLLSIQTAATAFNVFIPLYFIPLYFQFVRGDTAIKAAVRLLPYILILVTTNMAAGTLLPWIGY